MALSTDSVKKIIEETREDLNNPKSVESFLEKISNAIGRDSYLIELILEKIRRERIREIAKAQRVWFGALGWWFAKIFMWGGLFFAGIAAVVWGSKAADPITYCLLGGSVYYAFIQILTPFRLSSEEKRLDCFDKEREEATKALVEKIEKEYGIYR